MLLTAAAAVVSLAPLSAAAHRSAGPALTAPQAETAARPPVRLAHRRKRGAERKTRKRRPRQESLSQKHGQTPDAPVQLIVSLKNQRVAVFKGRQQLASAPISSGRPGYRTPTGIFSILQKKRRHYSNLYGGAPMPNMQRLTWSGIALHGGPLPGYPASHGCIRLPRSFARELFGVTEKGAHVIVAHDMPEPVEIEHANLFRPISRRAILAGGQRMQPEPGMPAAGDRRAGQGRPRLWLAGFASAPHAEKVAEADEERSAAEAASLRLADTEAKLDRLIAFERRSPAPLRILVSWRARGRELKQAQRMLAELGYEPGPVDGYLGRRTVGAIKRFRDDYALEPDWRVDEAMMAMLYRATDREPPASGHLYVRQNFTDLFDVPVHISGEEGTLGTHIYTLTRFDPEQERARWSAITLRERRPKADERKSARRSRKRTGSSNAGADETQAPPVPVASATEALARIDIPEHVRRRISDLLTPGSSLIISDNGISRETTKGTDFVVLTR